MAGKLRYTREELMASHAFARPHEAAGFRLHGGFDAEGAYISPRVLNRWPAVQAWGEALQSRGWPLIDATTSLLALPNYPTVAQEVLLLQNGFGRGLWNGLTTTGVVEARGRALVNLTPPDMQAIVVEDISETATGHLHQGLLAAHGMDEGGGDPRTPDQGAHDAMWFAVRDTVFGKDAYPLPEPPQTISRPAPDRELPQLPPAHEALIKLMMNVLMIEVRAESYFSYCCEVFRDPATFPQRRTEAEAAAVLVERIRTDEQIHVAYLQCVVSELRSFTLKTVDEATVPGAELLDPLWSQMVEWHGRLSREASRPETRREILADVEARLGAAEATAFMSRFDAFDDGALRAA